jgi:hypothetical protein
MASGLSAEFIILCFIALMVAVGFLDVSRQLLKIERHLRNDPQEGGGRRG